MTHNKIRVFSQPQGYEPMMLQFPSHEYRSLAAVAAKSGVRVSELVQHIVTRWLELPQKV